ncbi:ABC transporter ATP-binding protein [Methylorubrum aminovorans]|uniref:ABC transporter ATP-binding protein n=1 Tax=Methylorubrum aminovorans TaxID=269069 RepID=UPI003C2E6DE7
MILEVRDLAFGYGARAVGSGVSLTVGEGEALCLLGPNGGGKTTLFKTMLGLLRPLAGSVHLDGTDLSELPRREVAKKIAYVPQAHAAFFPFTVREVVLMGRASRLAAFASPGPADRAAAERALATLGIGHLAERIYTEISGGERQLALIARALAGEPRLLVMDEPTASLDFGNQARVLTQVRRLSEAGIAVVLSTHDPGHAFLCADRVALLHGGRLVALGPPAETVTPEHLRLLYGVEVAVVPLPGQGRTVCTPLIG